MAHPDRPVPAPRAGCRAEPGRGTLHRALLPAFMLLPLLLAGCAGMRAAREPLAPEAQQTLLSGLAGFSLRGRAAVNTLDPASGERKGFNASLSWKQQASEASFRLSGPFGAGTLTVTWTPESLRLAGGRGETYEGREAEQVLVNELGFVPPFESLRYWVLGLQAPGDAPGQASLADNGRLSELVQQQWRIRYTKWRNVRSRGGTVTLPQRLVVTRDDLRLTVVVDRWTL